MEPSLDSRPFAEVRSNEVCPYEYVRLTEGAHNDEVNSIQITRRQELCLGAREPFIENRCILPPVR